MVHWEIPGLKSAYQKNISTSVGVEPTNAACAPSTATSDVLNHYTIEASPKKDAQLAYITTPDAAVHSV